MDHDTIKEAVHAALNERDGLDRETHRVHHDYLRRRLATEEEGERRRAALLDKVKAMVIGALVIGALTAAGSWLYGVGRFVQDLYSKSQPPH